MNLVLVFYRFLYVFLRFLLLTIHLFIFNAGPMLIAVFITEMVILHKYVYLFIIIIITLMLRAVLTSLVYTEPVLLFTSRTE